MRGVGGKRQDIRSLGRRMLVILIRITVNGLKAGKQSPEPAWAPEMPRGYSLQKAWEKRYEPTVCLFVHCSQKEVTTGKCCCQRASFRKCSRGSPPEPPTRLFWSQVWSSISDIVGKILKYRSFSQFKARWESRKMDCIWGYPVLQEPQPSQSYIEVRVLVNFSVASCFSPNVEASVIHHWNVRFMKMNWLQSLPLPCGEFELVLVSFLDFRFGWTACRGIRNIPFWHKGRDANLESQFNQGFVHLHDYGGSPFYLMLKQRYAVGYAFSLISWPFHLSCVQKIFSLPYLIE